MLLVNVSTKAVRCAALSLALLSASLTPASAQSSTPADTELKRLYEEDQAERTPAPGKNIDWTALILRDEARQQRVKQLILADSLASGSDYYHAAMVLQHSQEVDDHLLAHDLCVIAISKGEPRARWLAAASLDRFGHRPPAALWHAVHEQPPVAPSQAQTGRPLPCLTRCAVR